jgi:hypothetical protein
MLKRIEAGEANAILAWHPDRLARNSVDGGKIIHLIDDGQIAMLTFANHWFEPTSQGKFALSMAFGLSKYFVDNLSENIRRGNRQKIANGLWPNTPPLGYLHDPQTKGIKPDPHRAPIMARLFKQYAAGKTTLTALRDRSQAWGLTTRTGNPLTTGRLSALLAHPVYTGMILYKGELHPGIHQPLVSRRLFNRVQSSKQSRRKPRHTGKSPHPMRGLFMCGECGCMFTMQNQKGILYLSCTKKKGKCSQRYLRADEAAKQIRWILQRLSLQKNYAMRLGYYFDQFASDGKSRSHHSQEIRNALYDIDIRIQRLNDAMVNGQVSSLEYAELKNPLVLKRHALEQKRIKFSNIIDHRLERLRSWIRGSKQAFTASNSNSLADMCRILRNLGLNHQILDKTISIQCSNFHLTVAQYGPFGIGAIPGARVSEPIDGDVLKGAGRKCLLESTGPMPLRLSYSPGAPLGHQPLHTPVQAVGGVKTCSSAVLS